MSYRFSFLVAISLLLGALSPTAAAKVQARPPLAPPPPISPPMMFSPAIPLEQRFYHGPFVLLGDDTTSITYLRMPDASQRLKSVQAWILVFPAHPSFYDTERYIARLYEFDCTGARMRLRGVDHLDDYDSYLSRETVDGEWAPAASGPESAALKLACGGPLTGPNFEEVMMVRVDAAQRAAGTTP